MKKKYFFLSKLLLFQEKKTIITVKIIADSINLNGNRLTTFELEYPRFIHAEFMTHRLFSRNSASSRAIPVSKMIENIKTNIAMPIHWGKNQKGMQANEEHYAKVEIKKDVYESREVAWSFACKNAIEIAEAFDKAGYHKQIVNRLLEPFQNIKVICSATEYDNFFSLRLHPDAQPEIKELANQMYNALKQSDPKLLFDDEYHLPYITSEIYDEIRKKYWKRKLIKLQ